METQLKPTLGVVQLWAIAVGLVISGEYFGWSYGWGVAGTLGFLVTSLVVAAMYTAFIFSYTELTTAIPHADGPFAYSRRAFGEKGGLIAGLATLIEFVFAPPAIAMAVFGAIVMYIMSMLSLFRLRKIAPELERTFLAPGYPLVPAIALVIAAICLVAMAWYNPTIGLAFLALMAAGFVYFLFTAQHRAAAPVDLLLTGADAG